MTTTTEATLTVLTDEVVTGDATWDGDHPVVAADDLPRFIGWELKTEGLCRANTCVPVPDRPTIEHPAGIDLVAVAKTLGRPTAVDTRAGLVAVGVPTAERQRTLMDRLASEFTLPDPTGTPRSLSDWLGRKRLLVTFASW